MKRFRFWEDSRVILEIFGSFSYSFPKEKKKQMADFYMLQLLLGRDSFERKRKLAWEKGEQDPYIMGGPRKLSDEDWTEEDKIDYMLNEVADELLPKLKEQLLNELVFSVTAEIRHVTDVQNVAIVYNMVKRDLGEKEANSIKKYFKYYAMFQTKYSDLTDRFKGLEYPREPEEGNSYQDSYKAYQKANIDPKEWMEICKYLFKEAGWSINYGGDAWAQIAEGWLRLNKAKTRNELFTYIDHVYDLEHNTGSVFSKLNQYYRLEGDGYDWIKKFLDEKRDIESPIELTNMISRPFKKLALRAIKMKWGDTQQGFKKSIKDEPKEKSLDLSMGFPTHIAEADYLYKQLRNLEPNINLNYSLTKAILMHKLTDEEAKKYVEYKKGSYDDVEYWISKIDNAAGFFSSHALNPSTIKAIIESENKNASANQKKLIKHELLNILYGQFGDLTSDAIHIKEFNAKADYSKKYFKTTFSSGSVHSIDECVAKIASYFFGELASFDSWTPCYNMASIVHLDLHRDDLCNCELEKLLNETKDEILGEQIKKDFNKFQNYSNNNKVAIGKTFFSFVKRYGKNVIPIVEKTLNVKFDPEDPMFNTLELFESKFNFYPNNKPILNITKEELKEATNNIVKVKDLRDLLKEEQWKMFFDYIKNEDSINAIRLMRDATGLSLMPLKKLKENLHMMRHFYGLCKCQPSPLKVF